MQISKIEKDGYYSYFLEGCICPELYCFLKFNQVPLYNNFTKPILVKQHSVFFCLYSFVTVVY